MVTVFTATYNRAYIISKLYESLLAQTNSCFEWLIVDDGSSDNTKKLAESWQQEGKIPIRYYYQENSGKSYAINFGAANAKGELFFVVDSDDIISKDAIEKIITGAKNIQNDRKYAGLSFCKMYTYSKEIVGDPYPYTGFSATPLDLIYKHRVSGDKAYVFWTDVMRKYPFPYIHNCKFIPEALIFNRMASDGFLLYCINDGIYFGEYLEDGYTKKFNENLKANKNGFALYYKEALVYKNISFAAKIKYLIRYLQCMLYKIKDI
jgi:glycosyltransferase involved in cell wall biosynthesis